jgi:hypothetical protein
MMKGNKPMKRITNITYPAIALLAFACFALAPQARAVCQDGCDGGNTFLGEDALMNNATGYWNTAVGDATLGINSTGYQNTATGADALLRNTEGNNNTADGAGALESNTAGNNNTATGLVALAFADGSNNTATGFGALYGDESNPPSTGENNTATGYEALFSFTTDDANTATGVNALFSDTTGSSNTATGANALSGNTTGNFNTAMGNSALRNNTGGLNTAIGHAALLNSTGNSNIAVGANAGSALTTGINNIDIGNTGVAGEANTIRIGTRNTHANTYVAGIYGAALGSGSTVRVDSAGHLGTVASSARFKKEIKPMDKASETILALHPVTFCYKEEIDGKGIPQFGLIAEEVEKVNPNLVERDQQNKPYTVRYEAVNAMLLNEFLKEHKTVQKQQKQIDNLEAELKEQKALIQKVSAQLTTGRARVAAATGLEISKCAPQTVINNQRN